MSGTLKNNAYHILGLDISASEKDIYRRSKEIINYLKVDVIPDYDIDVGVFKDFRNEDTVKDALQRLQAPKKRIKEYFFWLKVTDSIDEQVIQLFKQNNYSDAIRIYQEASEKQETKSFFYKKNLAVLYCLILSLKDNERYLKSSILIWRELLNSEKFWKSFSKLYKLHDDQTFSEDSIFDLKNHVVEYLSDIYTELYHIHKKSKYINEFQESFQVKGERIEKDIINPTYQRINKAISALKDMKISEDGIFDSEERESIKKIITIIQKEFNHLIDLGLYDDSNTRIMRDNVAEALRSIVLDLHNNLNETNVAILLLKLAKKIVGTSGLETKLINDIDTLEEIRGNYEIINPINELISNEYYEEALKSIKKNKYQYGKNRELREFYSSTEKLCVCVIALNKNKKAHEYLNNRKEELAEKLFTEAGDIIYKNIDIFSFNKESLNEILDDVRKRAVGINLRNIDKFDEYRGSILAIGKKFENELEGSAFLILVDAHLLSKLAIFLKKQRDRSGVVAFLNFLGWISVFYYGLGLIFFFIGWLYKNAD